MKEINPIFMIDFYKVGHVQQYPENVTTVFSNWTPRSSRIDGVNKIVHFGVQCVLRRIEEMFDELFFTEDLRNILRQYREIISATLGVANPKTDHIEQLWHHGALPIRIYSLPEGTLVPLGIPSIVIYNTEPWAFWLPNYLETMISNMLWKGMTSATIADRYKRLFEKWAILSGEKDLTFTKWQGHDFSYRGMSGLEDAVMSGMGHLLSFNGTDTIPAILGAVEYYGAEYSCGGSVPACFDKETELLTNSGFKKFDDLLETDLVAQYTIDGNIEFVSPTKYYKDRYKGKMYRFYKEGHRYIDICVTPNHKLVFLNKDRKIELKEASS